MTEGRRMRKVLGAAIGECVHIAGLFGFLSLAERHGLATVFLGPAVPLEHLVEAIRRERPDIVALGYRLTDTACAALLDRLENRLRREHLLDREYIFGGTPHTAAPARRCGLFSRVFDGTQPLEEIEAYLTGASRRNEDVVLPGNLLDRVAIRRPAPLMRHHIGLPTVEKTVEAVAKIAEAEVLDIISIAPDQTAQERFFRREERIGTADGAGGVPVRSEEDFAAIYRASQRGNHPLLRCYSGTTDLIKWAQMLSRTIRNAWAAIPLFWYNELDGRSPRRLLESIREAQDAIRWHAERGFPVECNEPHQWSLRYAPDAVAVAAAYIAAYNAKRLGVKHYIAQYMMQTPPRISPAGDLAKLTAMMELVESLHDSGFTSLRQVRPGIIGFPVDTDAAKGHLGAAAAIGTVLEPRIFHVVAFCEGRHAAGADEIIESTKIAAQVFEDLGRDATLRCPVDAPEVRRRRERLMEEASAILEGIRALGGEYPDPLAEPAVLARAVQTGLLDTPMFKGARAAKGVIATATVDGNCVSVDPATGRRVHEADRVRSILAQL